uniref:Cation efflux protein cytoplasmic domain-containing protein n=1 Tax=Aplanochytrium stocchinoi TaxID=215587 RepID=A0A7S3V097_9STRA|mmetsp:Transcript_16248/g.19372  ORF Transcript_16248/g.19372 Transcript_16248/m.19372 type:complete len:445 (-) Transcript_16248:143-1477(-)
MIQPKESTQLLSPSARAVRNKIAESRRQVKEARSKLLKASILCIFFMIIEVVGGYMAGSLAIMTDAAHLLSDVAGFLISLVALMLSDLSATKNLSFGFRRAEVLGALLSVALIWVLTGVLLYEAFLRSRNILYHSRDTYVDGKIMSITAVVGLVCNLIMLNILGHNHSHSHGGVDHGHSHDHSHENQGESAESLLEKQHFIKSSNNDSNNHGHSHSHSTSKEHGHSHGSNGHNNGDYGAVELESVSLDSDHSQEKNINVQAAYAHALGDLLQSIGVCIAGALIWRYPGPKYPMVQLADPIATFLFSVLVIGSTQQVLRSSISILMQSVPEGIDPIELCNGLEKIEGVTGIHHLHIWSITQGEPSLSVHVQVFKPEHMNPVLKRVQHFLRKRKFHHSTVQVEVIGEEICSEDECQGEEDCDGYALKMADAGTCHTYFTNEVKHSF